MMAESYLAASVSGSCACWLTALRHYNAAMANVISNTYPTVMSANKEVFSGRGVAIAHL